MREDEDFNWSNQEQDSQDEPYDYTDWQQEDGEPADPGETFSGAGKPVYEYDSGNERRYSHRMHDSERQLPVWFYAVIIALVVLFVIIGVTFISCSSNNTTTSDSGASEAALNAKVSETVAAMTTEQKVAQLFFVTPEQLTGVDVATEAGSATQTALATYTVGGVVYSAQNMQSDSQMKTLIATTQSYSKYELFIGADEGPGSASTLTAAGTMNVTATNDASTIGATGDSAQAYSAAHTIGGYLSNLGFNVTFSPVADTSTSEGTEALQSFGSDPSTVSSMVQRYVSGLQGQGVSATLKFFPGAGSTSEADANGIVSNNETLDEFMANEGAVYSAASEADFIMVGNMSAPSISGNSLPCTLSPVVIGTVLRDQLGYDGIIISAPMNSTAITANYTSAEASVAFIQAGGDMILEPADFAASYSAVLAAVQDGTISQERLDQSVSRIMKVKLAS